MSFDNPIQSEFYGDNVRWFIATVIDASPPFGFEGRVKIRIHGLHSPETYLLPQQDLPWAQCVLPTTEGGMSGIGKVPKLQANALVFGFFMDGMQSQTPVVVGSLPHIEIPTYLQDQQQNEDIGDDSKPSNVFQSFVGFFAPKFDVDDENNTSTGRQLAFGGVQDSRVKYAVQFFINIGYTENQALALTSGLFVKSGMATGGSGLCDWEQTRFRRLKMFSDLFHRFTVQVFFVAFELRTFKTDANIKLLATEKLDTDDGACQIVAKDYLDSRSIVEREELIGLIEDKARELKEDNE